jgi:glycosyltransferase involved in cell wall biosynthesis
MLSINRPAPLISVGMPVYNGERYLEEAIRSVLGQTFEDFILFISDNASTDRTERICRDYASQDRRINYTRNSDNIGAAKNYNRVFQLSSSPYFRWLNADDICAPDLHEKCLAVLESDPMAVLCAGKTCIIDETGQVVESCEDILDLQQGEPADRFMRFLQVVGLTNAIYGLMRRSAVAQTLLMGEGSFPAADINFMAQLTLYGKFVALPEVLFYRRIHPQASSWDRDNGSSQHQFWTGQRAEYILPTWLQNFAHLRAVRTAPIPISQKFRVTRHILRRMLWERERLAQELWQAVTQQFRNTRLIP